MQRYSYEFIKGRTDGGSGHYRIRDWNDNAVGFCYRPDNAQTLVDGLNALLDSKMLAFNQTLVDGLNALLDSKMLAFNTLSMVNFSRAQRWHKGGLDEWTPSDWACAAAGEMGEVCNAIKKYNRIVQHIQSNNNPTDITDALQKIATEIGDTIVYLDLLAQRLGIDTETAVRDTFNRISVRENMPERL